jgi:ParB family chromosome partitioning protein
MSTQNKQNNKVQIGKGIGALLGNIKNEINSFEKTPNVVNTENVIGSITRIPLVNIEINPKQPRRDFDEKALQELSESIQLHDIIQPITVIKLANKNYQLISGERRLRASKLASLTDIPAYIRTANDQELLEMALLENVQRENLNAIEIGLSFQRLMDECNFTQEVVAERMKKERSTVANYLRLLKLPPNIQVAVRNGTISMGHARALLGVEHIDQQLVAFKEVLDNGLSVRATEELVKKIARSKTGNNNVKKVLTNALPPAYKRIEDQLASHLSTKVNLDRKKNGSGSITIQFFTDSDLESILEKMKV